MGDDRNLQSLAGDVGRLSVLPASVHNLSGLGVEV